MNEKRNLTPEEAFQIQQMMQLINARKFEAAQVKANTALVPRGQEVCVEIEAIVRLLENTKNHFVAEKLVECGYTAGTKCSMNLADGTIAEETPVDNSSEETPAI